MVVEMVTWCGGQPVASFALKRHLLKLLCRPQVFGCQTAVKQSSGVSWPNSSVCWGGVGVGRLNHACHGPA